MSNEISDLWPKDVISQDFLTPRDILSTQAAVLESRMQGLVKAEVKETSIDEDDEQRVILRFEIFPIKGDLRVKLFEVAHRREFHYPVAVVEPNELPDFLKRKYYAPSAGELMGLMTSAASRILSRPGEWVENEGVCSTPNEFIAKLRNVLATSEVKSAVMAVLAEAKRDSSSEADSGPAANL